MLPLRHFARYLLITGAFCFTLGLLFSRDLIDYASPFTQPIFEFSQAYPVLFGFSFATAFIATTTLGMPGGAILCLMSGYFFGYYIGFTMAIFCTSISACLTWALSKTSELRLAPNILTAKVEPITTWIRESGYTAPLIIRLIPVLPFYLVNIALANSGVKFKVYIITTILGLIPSTGALIVIGRGTKDLFTTQTTTLDLLKEPTFSLPIAILILLSCGASIIKRYIGSSRPKR